MGARHTAVEVGLPEVVGHRTADLGVVVGRHIAGLVEDRPAIDLSARAIACEKKSIKSCEEHERSHSSVDAVAKVEAGMPAGHMREPVTHIQGQKNRMLVADQGSRPRPAEEAEEVYYTLPAGPAQVIHTRRLAEVGSQPAGCHLAEAAAAVVAEDTQVAARQDTEVAPVQAPARPRGATREASQKFSRGVGR